MCIFDGMSICRGLETRSFSIDECEGNIRGNMDHGLSPENPSLGSVRFGWQLSRNIMQRLTDFENAVDRRSCRFAEISSGISMGSRKSGANGITNGHSVTWNV